MATLNGPLTYSNTNIKGCVQRTGGPSLWRTSLCHRVAINTAVESKIECCEIQVQPLVTQINLKHTNFLLNKEEKRRMKDKIGFPIFILR